MSQKYQEIEPIELTPESHFKFRCHPGVSCFNECCAQTTIILSPYDVLRLKRHLNLTAAEFLERYSYQTIDDFSGLPLVVLNMDGGKKLCPFSTEAGCGVYDDRPATCRYYPVGVGSQLTEKGVEDCYVYIQEDHCQGFKEGGDWTLETWIQDQGLETYAEMDREWKSIMLQIGARSEKPVSAKFRGHYYQAAYDLDWFKGYIFDTDFLKVFEVEPELQERLRTEEEELLRFAFRYLKYMLRLGSTLKIRMPADVPDNYAPKGKMMVDRGNGNGGLNASPEEIAAILQHYRTAAVVGLSTDPARPSHQVARYLQSQGYRIIPVNPQCQEILGEKCYPSLTEVPKPVEVVDIFRQVEAIPGIVEEAIAVGAKVIWMQLGLESPEAAARARAAGLQVVMNRCMKIEHAQLDQG